jgi:uncharacterized membrane protein
MQNLQTFVSDISQKEFPSIEKVSAKLVRSNIFKLIQNEHPNFSINSNLAVSELIYYRQKYVASYVVKEIGEVSDLEKEVLDSINDNEILTKNTENYDKPLTFGQRLADKIAFFGGSWTFILSFFGFIAVWILINVFWIGSNQNSQGFDPYPFILLNLILSCLASLQAPVIMMSQNRQEEKDRLRATKDYMTNLKAELEIRMLHEKVDHLIINQQQELIDIQKEQLLLLENILGKVSS